MEMEASNVKKKRRSSNSINLLSQIKYMLEENENIEGTVLEKDKKCKYKNNRIT